MAFEPKDEDIFIRTSKGDYQRLIFGEPLPLTEREINYLDELKTYLIKNDLTIPPG
jgi:hypothetical protein